MLSVLPPGAAGVRKVGPQRADAARLQGSSSGLTYSEVALSGIVQGRGSLAVGWDGSRFISFQKEMDNLCMA